MKRTKRIIPSLPIAAVVECSTLHQEVPGLSPIACVCFFFFFFFFFLVNITSGLQILIPLCNDVGNYFSYDYMATSKRSSTRFKSSFRVDLR